MYNVFETKPYRVEMLAHGGNMKRFLMYIVVTIVLAVAGVSIYYVVRNDEKITNLMATSEKYYINVGETVPIPIEREHPASYTEMTVDQDFEGYLEVDIENWTITALVAGPTSLTFRSTNEGYASETFEVLCQVGDGSETYPYYLRNEDDLLHIGLDGWSYYAHYELVNDITMTKPMLPIGILDESGEIRYDAGGKIAIDEFSGSLTGGIDRHKISNAQIIQGTYNYGVGGFFATIAPTGRVENIVFDNVVVDGRFTYAGVIAGKNYGWIGMCQITNSKVVNNYELESYTGGVVGLNNRVSSGHYASINIVSADVEVSSKYVGGGIAGRNQGGVIYNCFVKLNANFLPLTDSYTYFGGIAGLSRYAQADDGEIFESYVSNVLVMINKANTTSQCLGGIFGMYGAEVGANNAKTLGTYENLYYSAPTVFMSPAYRNYGENPLDAQYISANDALKQDTFQSFDFRNVWYLEEDMSINLGFERFDGGNLEYEPFITRVDANEISDINSLKLALTRIRTTPNANRLFKITKSVVFDGAEQGRAWEPIGTLQKPFIGQILSENGATITFQNIDITETTGGYAGIFGYVAGENTIIEGIHLEESTAFDSYSTITGTVVGGIVGYNSHATIRDCQVSNVTISTKKYVGLIAGYNSGKIENCQANATTTMVDQFKLDEDGNQIQKTKTQDVEVVKKDADGNPIQKVDENGTPVVDANGNPVYETEKVQKVDENGAPVVDANGNPVYETEEVPIIDENGNPVYETEKVPATNSKGQTIYESSSGTIAVVTIVSTSDIRDFYLGGIVGKNKGTVSSSTACGFNLDLLSNADKRLFIGGICGENAGIIIDSAANSFTINGSEFAGEAYVGGVVGFMTEQSVESSYLGSVNNIRFNINNENVFAGGIAGRTAPGTKILYSVVSAGTVIAYHAGGFAGICAGDVEQSYVSKSFLMQSKYAGGFAERLYGKISNCMTAAGLEASEIAAGMTVYLEKGSVIDLSYIDPNFVESASASAGFLDVIQFVNSTKYAETSSPFKVHPDQYGVIQNTYIVGEYFPLLSAVVFEAVPYDKMEIGGVEVKIQTAYLFWGADIKVCERTEVLNITTMTQKGFDSEIWGGREEGGYVLPIKAEQTKLSATANTGGFKCRCTKKHGKSECTCEKGTCTCDGCVCAEGTACKAA